MALVVVVWLVGSALAAKTRAFTQNNLGARIILRGTDFEIVYKVTNSQDGSGAAVEVGKGSGTGFPISGSETTTTYFANGISKSKGKFTLGAPNAKGISVLTADDRCVPGGTGVHKHERCRFTVKGTSDLKTGITEFRAKGTVTR